MGKFHFMLRRRLKSRFILIVIAAASLFGMYGFSIDRRSDMNITAPGTELRGRRAPIDEHAPVKFETTTFAYG